MSVTRGVRRPLPRRSLGRLLVGRRSFAWVGVVPFFLYMALFLLLPALSLVLGAFQSDAGGLTLSHVQVIFQGQFVDAYKTSIRLSVVTALSGGILGLFTAYALVKEGSPGWLRSAYTTFSGVAANFAGIPLAFAFIATLGTTGIVTVFLRDRGFDLYGRGFTLYHFTGLALTYTYFQFPLMILIISPALDGLRREWREAATNLGATTLQFWRWVGLPILLPSLLGAMVLLFGSAFAAYATAYALVGGTLNLVPLVIGISLSSDLLSDPHLADSLATGMIVIISLTVLVYGLLMRRANRWVR
jgi:putative spermidine/putrescine transport system permease protein